jgi:hypothetical protein
MAAKTTFPPETRGYRIGSKRKKYCCPMGGKISMLLSGDGAGLDERGELARKLEPAALKKS